ncbi:MAG: PH domain-containing protein [Ectobacillus sp.]
MKFSVKKNNVLVGTVIGFAPLGLFLFIAGLMGQGFISFMLMLLGIGFLGGGGLLIWSLFHSYLEITEEHLINHFGFFQSQITLERIRAIRFVNESSPAFAWTFLRMQVVLFPHALVTVALPEDVEGFLAALEQKVPQAEVDNKSIHSF